MNSHLWRIPVVDGFVAAFRRVLFSSAIFDALHALDGETHYTLHQSIFFFESPLSGPHIEAVSLDTMPRGRSFTVWAAVDPVTPRNGPPYVVPRPLGHYDPDPPERTIPAHYRVTYEGIQAGGEMLAALTLNPGDFIVWAPGTPHGSMGALPQWPVRRSFQAIYRPTRINCWGGYPNHDETHSVADEEIVVDERFSILKVALPQA
jgi:ectoine hydroxylase-related dioxygenase (phytanoyl-CoA dioxygenase family)